MEPDQKAALQEAMAEAGHPGATPEAAPEGTPDVQNDAQTAPNQADSGSKLPTEDAPKDQPTDPALPRHQQVLQRMMERARQEREAQEKQSQEQQLREQADYARQLMEARQRGPDDLLRAAGLEPPPKKEFSLADLFGDDKDEGEKPPEKLTELEKKLAQTEEYIKKLQEERTQEKQTLEQQQMQYHIQNEIKEIETYLNENKDKYEFVDAARDMGSINDLYNGRVSMYNQGYNPTNEEMIELVEARMEELIRVAAPTKKGRSLIEELFGVRLPSENSASTTLSEVNGGETPAGISSEHVMTDEENRQLALKEAMAIKEALLKERKAAIGQ